MIIEIKGGIVQNVFTDLEVEIQIKDYDLKAIGEDDVIDIDTKPFELYARCSQQFEH